MKDIELRFLFKASRFSRSPNALTPPATPTLQYRKLQEAPDGVVVWSTWEDVPYEVESIPQSGGELKNTHPDLGVAGNSVGLYLHLNQDKQS